MSTLVARFSWATYLICSCLGKTFYASLTYLSAAAFRWFGLPANLPFGRRLHVPVGSKRIINCSIFFMTLGGVGRCPSTSSTCAVRCALTSFALAGPSNNVSLARPLTTVLPRAVPVSEVE
jgi:hypothetical protein